MPKPIAAVRLIVIPDLQKAGRFTAHLEDTGDVIVSDSRQPLADGARELIARGFDPDAMLTMRHEGSRHDSFRPAPIRAWAKWTYQEGERRALSRARWMPFAGMTGQQKSDVWQSAGRRAIRRPIHPHGRI